MENFSVSPRKKLEKYPDCQERHVRNWVTESEKSGFFFQKSSKKAKKLWKQTEKFLTLHRKKAGKIIPTKRKRSQKTDDPDEKTADYFLQADGKNAEKDARLDRKICRTIRKNMKISRRKENKCISGRMVHSEKIDFLSKEDEEKNRLMEKKQENHNRQGRKHS